MYIRRIFKLPGYLRRFLGTWRYDKRFEELPVGPVRKALFTPLQASRPLRPLEPKLSAPITLPRSERPVGHRNPKDTSRYPHLGDKRVPDAAKRIGDAVGRKEIRGRTLERNLSRCMTQLGRRSSLLACLKVNVQLCFHVPNTSHCSDGDNPPFTASR